MSKKPLQTWLFYVCLQGVGSNREAAWQDACEQFGMDPGYTPERGMTQKTLNRLVRDGLRTPSAIRHPDDEEG